MAKELDESIEVINKVEQTKHSFVSSGMFLKESIEPNKLNGQYCKIILPIKLQKKSVLLGPNKRSFRWDWTEEAKDYIQFALSKNYPLNKIAKDMGIPRNTLKHYCKKEKWIEEGYSAIKRWTEEEKEYIYKLLKRGTPRRKVAEEIGTSYYQIRYLIYRDDRYQEFRVHNLDLPKWTDNEINGLINLIELSTFDLNDITKYWQKHYTKAGWSFRTQGQIKHKIKQLNLNIRLRDRMDILTLTEIQSALQIGREKVEAWVGLMGLSHEKYECYMIKPDDFVKFILDNPIEFTNITEPESIWWLLTLINDHVKLIKSKSVATQLNSKFYATREK